jgi:hypothetical protein
MQAVAERFIAEYFQDMDRLNIKRADLYPRATRSLRAMFELIQSLELKGFAYRVRDPLAPQGRDLLLTMSTMPSVSSRITASSPVASWRSWRQGPVAGWEKKERWQTGSL